MILDEAIKHYEQLAENQIKCADRIDELHCDSTTTRYMAEHHRQLAEWLRELKALSENEEVKEVFKDCDTCKYLSLEADDYPCDRCCHRYINQYVYDDKREVNADDDSD